MFNGKVPVIQSLANITCCASQQNLLTIFSKYFVKYCFIWFVESKAKEASNMGFDFHFIRISESR